MKSQELAVLCVLLSVNPYAGITAHADVGDGELTRLALPTQTESTTNTHTVGTARVIVDTDVDGIEDSADNCVDTPNSDQLDTNLDGFGNRCDADFNNDNIVNVAAMFSN